MPDNGEITWDDKLDATKLGTSAKSEKHKDINKKSIRVRPND